jgi:chromosome condensin MukBEF ATPase and DNA-binding subunit MukB
MLSKAGKEKRMSDSPSSNVPTASEIKARLQEIAQRLRGTETLDREAQRSLAELVEELTQTLETENLPPAERAHLAQTAEHLEQTLRHHHDRGVLGKLRESLERAIGAAETTAPVTVGFTRRLLDTLANIGI